MEHLRPHRIVVLGAGYAGLLAARRLTRLLRPVDAHVVLVDRSDRFTERVRLHQAAAGQRLPGRPLAELAAGAGIDFVRATVTGIDLGARSVLVSTAPGLLPYDTLVYALGSGADLETVPGVREHAFSVADGDQAQRLRNHLRALAPDSRVVVVGGGLTGIEAAAELAEARPDLRVDLLSASPAGDWLCERARRHLHQAAQRLGIGMQVGRVDAVDAGVAHLVDGRALPADVVVWAAGFAVPGLAADAGLTVDPRGRVVVDDRLRAPSHPEVYVIGDAAAAPGRGGAPSRMSCQTGMPMGWYVAGAIARTLAGRDPRPHRVRYVWQNVSLGRSDGLTQFTRFDDSPLRLALTGPAAARFKEAITCGAAWAVQR